MTSRASGGASNGVSRARRPGGEPRREFVRGQIEPVGRQRPIVGFGGIFDETRRAARRNSRRSARSAPAPRPRRARRARTARRRHSRTACPCARRTAAANARGRSRAAPRSPPRRARRRGAARRTRRHRPGGSGGSTRVVSRASLTGARSSARNGPTLSWVSGSKARIDSSVSPKKSSRIGAGAPGG